MSNHEFKFDLGDRVRDNITGFEGVITGFAKYLNGCINYCLKPTDLDKKGEMKDGQWVDEPQLFLVAAEVLPAPVASAGGPRPDQAPER